MSNYIVTIEDDSKTDWSDGIAHALEPDFGFSNQVRPIKRDAKNDWSFFTDRDLIYIRDALRAAATFPFVGIRERDLALQISIELEKR